MKLYSAAVYTSNFEIGGNIYNRLEDDERKKRDSLEHILESYHYIHKESVVAKIRRDKVRVFLDSGAFSAFTQKVTIDLGRYCDYIHKNADVIEYASVLDSIGDYKGTWRNQAEMERRGTRPLPCYHFGEPIEVLEYYVQNYEYITIGGMVPISTPQLKIWLDRVWADHLTLPDGTPKVKVHGFGLTSLPLMLRYPWYSVDSSSWQAMGSNGLLLFPDLAKVINISNRSPNRKVWGQHVDAQPQMITEALEKQITKEGGDPERMREYYFSRWAWNIWALTEFVERRGGVATKFKTIEQRIF